MASRYTEEVTTKSDTEENRCNEMDEWEKKWEKKWDVYEEGNLDKWKTGICEKLEGFLKLTFAAFLFVIILVSGILSRITLHIMIWHLQPPAGNITSRLGTMGYLLEFRDDQCENVDVLDCMNRSKYVDEEWIWALFLVIIIPYIFGMFSSARKMCKQNGEENKSKKEEQQESWRSKNVLFLASEVLDTIGVFLMVFVVLPAFDPATASVVYLVVGLPLCLLDWLDTVRQSRCQNSSSEENGVKSKGKLKKCTKFLKNTKMNCFYSSAGVMFCILSILFVIFYIGFDITVAIFSISMLFIGIRYYQNFTKHLSGETQLIDHNRMTVTCFSFLAKISVLIICLLVTVHAQQGLNALFGSGESNYRKPNIDLELGNDETCANYVPFVVATINILSSLVFYKTAKTACAICCQIVVFGFAIIFLVPVINLVALIKLMEIPQTLKFQSCDIFFSQWRINSISDIGNEWWQIPVSFTMAILSFACLCRFVFFTNGVPQSKTSRLFMFPFYCGIYIDKSVILNRRKYDTKEDNNIQSKKIKNTSSTTTTEHIRQTSSRCGCISTKNGKQINISNETNIPLQSMKTVYLPDNRKYEIYSIKDEDLTDLSGKYDLEEESRQENSEKTKRENNDKGTKRPIITNRVAEEYIYTREESPLSSKGLPDVNNYVKTFLKSIEEAQMKLYDIKRTIDKPRTLVTPYGGRIECTLPLDTKLVIHLKDKTKIRARKRWSQVMYMYYLLGHLSELNPNLESCKEKADNTFILALDGDVDFNPQSVKHLLNRMLKDPNVGAACGRIHPIGSGVMVWYQKFEYAISHWLQKATEHVTGCVLCSPGCFSMFRASALMDRNVLKTYTTEATQARHHVQYDQGEDRWLCTLLLKQGYRVDYSAEADAFTYAPENFDDFWKQRRRWTPSTMANVLDILTDSNELRKKNPNISRLYIVYQLQFGSILSAIYTVIMLIVLMGLLKIAVEERFCSTTTIILCFVASVFVIAAACHPKEASCLIHGLLFFIAIPSMSMLMFLYSVANLNNVNWGTREKATNDDKVKNNQDRDTQSRYKAIRSFFMFCCRTKAKNNKPSDIENTEDTEKANNDTALLSKFGLNRAEQLDPKESKFWDGLIKKYLLPKEPSRKQKLELEKELLQLRNRVCIIIFMVNTFLVTLIYALSEADAFKSSLVLKIQCDPQDVTIDPISVLFTLTFGILLLVQFVCMIYHRFSTLIHITAESKYFGQDTTEDDVKKQLFDCDNWMSTHCTSTGQTNERPKTAKQRAVKNVQMIQVNQGTSKTNNKRQKSAIREIQNRTAITDSVCQITDQA
ncbi:CHS1 [Mytilus edulis]|uniref:chitin synthase n=1 Tax=Mytilus edulis TaxID=6550 RepID=A0A8S3RFE2_MYTED|nr:CHS1 [Mytilus edulis]